MDRMTWDSHQFQLHIKGLLKSLLRVGVGIAFLSAITFAVGDLTLFGSSRTFHQAIVLVVHANVPLILVFIFSLIKPPEIRFQTLLSPWIVLSGFLYTCGQIVALFANKTIGPSNAAALYYTMPVFAVIFSYIFLNYEIQKLQVISVILSLLGVFFITGDSSTKLTSDTADDQWVIVGICAGLVGAASHAGSITIRAKLKDCNIESSAFVVSYSLQYSVVSVIYCIVSGAWTKPCIRRIDLCMLAVCGCNSYFAAMFLYIAVSLESPSTVSVILTTSIFFVCTGQEILFPYMTLGWMSITGALFIFGACVLVAFVDHRSSPSNETGDRENCSLREEEECSILKAND